MGQDGLAFVISGRGHFYSTSVAECRPALDTRLRRSYLMDVPTTRMPRPLPRYSGDLPLRPAERIFFLEPLSQTPRFTRPEPDDDPVGSWHNCFSCSVR